MKVHFSVLSHQCETTGKKMILMLVIQCYGFLSLDVAILIQKIGKNR